MDYQTGLWEPVYSSLCVGGLLSCVHFAILYSSSLLLCVSSGRLSALSVLRAISWVSFCTENIWSKTDIREMYVGSVRYMAYLYWCAVKDKSLTRLYTIKMQIFVMMCLVIILRGLDKLRRNWGILYKGDNCCDFLFAFLYTRTLLKRGLL